MPVSRSTADATDIARRLAAIYERTERTLAEQIAERLSEGIELEDWQTRKLAVSGELRRWTQRLLDRLQGEIDDALGDDLIQAYRSGGLAAQAELGAAAGAGVGAWEAAGQQFGGDVAVQMLQQQFLGKLGKLETPVARWAQDSYQKAVLAGSAPDVLLGTLTRRQATQKAWEGLLNQGIVGFTDKAGRNWNLASYVEMATRTTVAHAAVEGHLDRLLSVGVNLVVVSNAPANCPKCGRWEGRVLTIDGAGGERSVTVQSELSDDYVTVMVAGSVPEATAAGLFHPHCRHSLSAYIPGVTETPSIPVQHPEQYVATQQQRALERAIRGDRLQIAGALDDAAATKWTARLDQHEAQLRDHIAANGDILRFKPDRIKVDLGMVARIAEAPAASMPGAAAVSEAKAAKLRGILAELRITEDYYKPRIAALQRQMVAAGGYPVGFRGQFVRFDPALHTAQAGKIVEGTLVRIELPGVAAIDDTLSAAETMIERAVVAPHLSSAPLIEAEALSAAPMRWTRGPLDVPGLLTSIESASLGGYSAAAYESINASLRGLRVPGGWEDIIAESVPAIDSAMARSGLTADVTVWRGFDAGDHFPIDGDLTGASWVDKGYVSTSAARKTAENFGNFDPVLMKISLPRGTRAIELVGPESELLLERGLTFKVTADHGIQDGRRLLDVEIVPVKITAPKIVERVDIPGIKPGLSGVEAGDFTGLKRIGPQAGSNPGGLFEAPDGTKWYVKAQHSADHAANEVLATELYRAAGIDIPQVVIGTGIPDFAGSTLTASRVVDGTADLRKHLKDPEYLAQIREGFAVDAWLANWDVAGTGFDNVITVAGHPHRVDAGGSLLFRAQGAPKGSAFTEQVGEWTSLRDKASAPYAYRIFEGITPAQIKASVAKVEAITPAQIRALVKQYKLPDELADKLIARRADVIARANAEVGVPVGAIKSTPVKVIGRDLTAELDYQQLDAIPHIKGRNEALEAIWQKQGFSGPPRVVTDAEWRQLKKQGGHPIYRGVRGQKTGLSADEIAERYATEHHQATSYGVFGSGAYFTDSRVTAVDYSHGKAVGMLTQAKEKFEGGAVVEAMLLPDAKIIEFKELKRKMQEFGIPEGFTGVTDPRILTLGDEGSFASALGYDAIVIRTDIGTGDYGKEYIILNRTATAIKSATATAGASVIKAAPVVVGDIGKMTVPQLRTVAKDRGIVIPAKAKKADIVKLLGGESADLGPTVKATKAAKPVAPTAAQFDAKLPAAAKGKAALEAPPLLMDEAEIGRTISAQEYSAMTDYQGEDEFRGINDSLRAGDDGIEIAREIGFGGTVDALDALMARSTLHVDALGYRGVSDGAFIFGDAAWSGSLVGADWTERAFLSTSAKEQVAKNFALDFVAGKGAVHTDRGAVMRILLPDGAGAVQIGDWSDKGLSAEFEILAQRDLRLTIVKDYKKGGLRYLDIVAELPTTEPAPTPVTKVAKPKAAPKPKAVAKPAGEIGNADLAKLTVPELKVIAKDRGIKIAAKDKKADILAKLTEAPTPAAAKIDTDLKVLTEANVKPPPAVVLEVRPELRAAKTAKQVASVTAAEIKRLTGKGAVYVELGGSTATAREHAEGLLRAIERYPESTLRSISSVPLKPGETAYAQAYGLNGVIQFNGRWTSAAARKQYLASLDEGVAGWGEKTITLSDGRTITYQGDGFHVRGSNTVAAIAIHEYGHIVDIGALGSSIRDDLEELLETLAVQRRISIDDMIAKDVSRYAVKNRNELVAEAFTDVLINGDRASELSQEIIALIDEAYKRKYRRS